MWVFNWRYLIKYKKTLVLITIASFVWGLIFDIVASSVLQLWFYNDNLNIYFLGLPLEEYIFLIFVPPGLVSLFLLVRRRIFKK